MSTGLTTKEVAAQFNITGKQLRRILRSFERYDDKTYTRYTLSKRDIDQVAKRLEGSKPEPTPKKKAKKIKKVKPASIPSPDATQLEPTHV